MGSRACACARRAGAAARGSVPPPGLTPCLSTSRSDAPRVAVLGGCVVTGERISLWSDVRLVPSWPLLACGLAAARRPQTLSAVRLQTGLLALCPRNPCDGQGQAVTLAPCGAFSTLDSVLAAAPRRPRRGAWGSASPRLAAGRRPGRHPAGQVRLALPPCLQRPPRAAAPVHGRLGVRPEGPCGRVTSGCGRPPWGPVRVALVTGRPIAQRAALAWPSGRPPRRTSAVHDPEQLSQGTSGARGAASGRHRGGGRGSGPSWAGRGGFAEACVQAHRSRRRPGPAWPRLGLLTPAAAAGAAAGSARLPPSRLPLLCSSWVAFVCTLRCDKSLLSSPVYLS